MKYLALILTLFAGNSLAASKVTFSKSGISRTVMVADIVELVETGDEKGVEVLLQAAPKQEIIEKLQTSFNNLNPSDADKALTSKAGNYILTMISQRVKPRSSSSQATAIKALRGAVIMSLADDDKATFLEILENYPLDSVHVELN